MIGLLPILIRRFLSRPTPAGRIRPVLLAAALLLPALSLPGTPLVPGVALAIVGDISIADGPPGTEVTLRHDGTGDQVSIVTDTRGRGVLPLVERNWSPGKGTISYTNPRTGEFVQRKIDITDGSRLMGLDYEHNEGDTSHEGFSTKRLAFMLGAGWAREIHEDSPDGALALQGSITHPLCNRWNVGIGGGYYWLGSTETTYLGQTGEVTLSAVPLWAEISYDLRSIEHDDRAFRPFLVVGGGPYWRRTGGDFPEEDCDCVDFGVNMGVGFDNIAHQGKVALGLEGRYHNVLQEGLSGFQMVSGLVTARWR